MEDKDNQQKKGLFSRLSGALFEEVDKTAEPAAAQPTAKIAKPVPGAKPEGTAAASAQMELTTDSKALAADLRVAIARKGEPLAKFLKLVDSFKDIIAEEPKRFAAAQKALAETGGLGRDVILSSLEAQLKELKARAEVYAAQVDIKRTELKGSERRAADISAQITTMTETIKRLEEEEKAVLASMAASQGKIKDAESAFAEAAKEVEAELVETRKKIEANVKS